MKLYLITWKDKFYGDKELRVILETEEDIRKEFEAAKRRNNIEVDSITNLKSFVLDTDTVHMMEYFLD